MSGQTLEQLRAANAAEEAAAAKKAPPEDTLQGDDTLPADDTLPGEDTIQGDDTLEAGEDTQEGGDDTAEGADTVAGEDDWMKPEGEEKLPDVVDNGTAKQIRLKYQGQAKAAKDEAEALRKENEDLKKKLVAPVVSLPDKPKREAFTTEEEYLEAVAAHAVTTHFKKGESEQVAAQRKAQMEQQAAETEKEVEAHYARAAVLAKKSNIKPETYQAADLSVRKSMQTVFGDASDNVMDNLIARVGAGSEKAMYYLGVNPSKQAELLNTFKQDPTGLKAAVYLTRLAERLNAPKAKESSTPEPPETIRGDNQKGKGAGGQYKKDWQKAHDAGDIQAAVAIRRKAQAAKVDVSQW